ncbi:MAG TPA: bifunctional riboflavin kinase/FAD synthetase [Candidatus Enterocloster faecavium]|uniref:Riboflavin biosynthesis protein n=1 Tax=Candidatus Enterocloster faecavium TaxID=2838560 RepID=A0A9D2L9T2_9FIRM|nr:bifunctional riboflavin kinase/FAD synthetase [Candidatus Enterocloster faecavium]
MHYITNTVEFQIHEPTVVTIGKFDGRHRGHQKLMAQMRRVREQYGYRTAVFTFSVTPDSMVTGKAQRLLTTNLERRRNMEQTGIDYLVEYPFTKETLHMMPEDFVRDILVGQMNAKAIVVGPDCSFGYNRLGDAELLRKLEDRYHYKLWVIEKEKDDERDISSTYIREELDKGNVEKAWELLGEPYAIHGAVVHGKNMGGRILGFPTANLVPPSSKRLPMFGVYVSRVKLEGRLYRGVTDIGKKPTVEGDNPVGVETYIFDLNRDIYGVVIEVQLLAFIRGEMRFDSIEDLKAQIGRDKERARQYFEEHRELIS